MYLINKLSKTHCSKLAAAWLPDTTKTLFREPVFRKNKGSVARDFLAFAIWTIWIFSPNLSTVRVSIYFYQESWSCGLGQFSIGRMQFLHGRRGFLMVSELDSGLEQAGFEHWPGHCVVFLGKTLYCHSHLVPLSTQMYNNLGTVEFTAGGNPAMD